MREKREREDGRSDEVRSDEVRGRPARRRRVRLRERVGSAPSGEHADTLRAGRDGQSLLRIHDGSDWSQQSGTQTGETVKYAYMASSAFVRTAVEAIRTDCIRFDVHPL